MPKSTSRADSTRSDSKMLMTSLSDLFAGEENAPVDIFMSSFTELLDGNEFLEADFKEACEKMQDSFNHASFTGGDIECEFNCSMNDLFSSFSELAEKKRPFSRDERFSLQAEVERLRQLRRRILKKDGKPDSLGLTTSPNGAATGNCRSDVLDLGKQKRDISRADLLDDPVERWKGVELSPERVKKSNVDLTMSPRKPRRGRSPPPTEQAEKEGSKRNEAGEGEPGKDEPLQREPKRDELDGDKPEKEDLLKCSLSPPSPRRGVSCYESRSRMNGEHSRGRSRLSSRGRDRSASRSRQKGERQCQSDSRPSREVERRCRSLSRTTRERRHRSRSRSTFRDEKRKSPHSSSQRHGPSFDQDVEPVSPVSPKREHRTISHNRDRLASAKSPNSHGSRDPATTSRAKMTPRRVPRKNFRAPNLVSESESDRTDAIKKSPYRHSRSLRNVSLMDESDRTDAIKKSPFRHSRSLRNVSLMDESDRPFSSPENSPGLSGRGVKSSYSFSSEKHGSPRTPHRSLNLQSSNPTSLNLQSSNPNSSQIAPRRSPGRSSKSSQSLDLGSTGHSSTSQSSSKQRVAVASDRHSSPIRSLRRLYQENGAPESQDDDGDLNSTCHSVHTVSGHSRGSDSFGREQRTPKVRRRRTAHRNAWEQRRKMLDESRKWKSCAIRSPRTSLRSINLMDESDHGANSPGKLPSSSRRGVESSHSFSSEKHGSPRTPHRSLNLQSSNQNSSQITPQRSPGRSSKSSQSLDLGPTDHSSTSQASSKQRVAVASDRSTSPIRSLRRLYQERGALKSPDDDGDLNSTCHSVHTVSGHSRGSDSFGREQRTPKVRRRRTAHRNAWEQRSKMLDESRKWKSCAVRSPRTSLRSINLMDESGTSSPEKLPSLSRRGVESSYSFSSEKQGSPRSPHRAHNL